MQQRPVQTSYSNRQPIGIHGGLYAAHESPDVVSNAAEILPVPPATEPEGVIAFGVAVTTGTSADDQVQQGDGSGGTFLRITIKSVDREQNLTASNDGYMNKETVAVNRAGYQYITCPEGCVKGDPVDYTPDGVLHNGGGGTVILGAQWEFTTAAGALGVVRLVALNPTT